MRKNLFLGLMIIWAIGISAFKNPDWINGNGNQDNKSTKSGEKATAVQGNMSIEEIADIKPYLESLRLDDKYDYLHVEVAKDRSAVEIEFYNPDGRNFQMNIYDLRGNLIRTYLDLREGRVTIEREGFDQDYYNYVIKDNRGTYYAGKIDFTKS